VVTLLELFGGLAIIAGAFVALVSLPLVISMLVATFTVQLRYGFSSVNTIGLTEAGPVFGPPGYEINLLYIAGLLVLVLGGPGPLSVDHWLARRMQGAASNPGILRRWATSTTTPPPPRRWRSPWGRSPTS
jgi:putative oxidoreductase